MALSKTMTKYRKRPIVIDAMRWTGDNIDEVLRFCPMAYTTPDTFKFNELGIRTLEGNMQANRNDWIIKGIKGEFYPCKPDIFEKTYEAVEQDND